AQSCRHAINPAHCDVGIRKPGRYSRGPRSGFRQLSGEARRRREVARPHLRVGSHREYARGDSLQRGAFRALIPAGFAELLRIEPAHLTNTLILRAVVAALMRHLRNVRAEANAEPAPMRSAVFRQRPEPAALFARAREKTAAKQP